LIEEWRDIAGFEGFYQVSNMGRIRSLDREFLDRFGKKRKYKGRLMTPTDAGKGYKNVQLSKAGKHCTPRVCRLVAAAFLENKNNYPQVNHKDENKQNDRADNLEWCTPEYNNAYGTRAQRSGEKRRKPVNQYDLNGNLIKRWGSIREASKILKIDNSHITRCCRKRLKKTGGFMWQYAENN